MQPASVIRFFLALLILTLCTTQARAEETLPEIIKKTKPAVVQVNGYDADGKLFKYGSGFLVSPGGDLITHRSLVLGVANLKVKTMEEQEYPIRLVLADDATSELVKLLVDRPEPSGPHLAVTAAPAEAGERVLVMGTTRKGEFTVDEAMVSSVRDFLTMGKVMQLSTPFNPSIHGGPVLNLKGEVVGVAGMGKSEGRDFPYGILGAKILALKTTTVMNFPEWAATHLKEAADAYAKKGDASLKGNHYEDAQSHFRSAVRVNPKDPELQVKLGLAYLKDNKHREAAEAFRKAVELKQDHADAHYYLGLASLKLDNQAAVQKEVEVLKRLDPKMADRLLASVKAEARGAAGTGDLPELVRKVKPAVVRVFTFDRKDRPIGYGSGFFVNPRGHFITNYHVLGGAARAKVKTQDDKIYPVIRLLAEDRPTDLILAAIASDTETPYLPISKVLPEVGERVVVIGNPKGLEWTVADGVVSAIRNYTQGRWIGKFIQTSAPISPGSSGGPAINMKGEVIGVNTFHQSAGQLLDFSSSALNILALKAGPGLTLEERADGWREEAKDLLNVGRASMREKKYSNAVDVFERAVELAPDLPEARYELCWAYVTVGNEDGAVNQLKTLRELDPRLANELVRKLKARTGSR